MNCNGYLDVEFAKYLVIDNWMEVKQYNNLGDIPLSIAINIDNINFYKTEEIYTLPTSVTVPNPCFPDDAEKAIIIDEVTLSTIKATGYIGYYVGADVLVQSTNVELSPESTTSNVAIKSDYATVSGIIPLDNLDFLIQNDPNDVIPQVKVTIINFNVASDGENNNGDHYYLIEGTFRIEPSN